MANPTKWLDDLIASGATSVNSQWLKQAAATGVIKPGMPADEIHRAVARMASAPQPRQMQLPMSSADATPDIRALIRYGNSGPGVPVTPTRPTYYTPEMQAQAMASGTESVATGPRVAQKQGGLIPSPVDPRRFTMGDVPPSTGYTPEMMAEAAGRGPEPTFRSGYLGYKFPATKEEFLAMPWSEQRRLMDLEWDATAEPRKNLPGRVATPEELAAQRMYDQAAGYVEDIRNPPESRALAVFNRPGAGVPVDGPAGGSRGLITTPSLADHMRGMARRGMTDRRGLLIGATAAGVGGEMISDAMDDEPAMTTGGEAELANESRPAPVVTPTQAKPEVEWAADKADPAKEAKFTAAFKKSYEARHPDFSDLPDNKRQSLAAMMRAGISQQRANEIVRGNYSLSPAEYNMLRSSR